MLRSCCSTQCGIPGGVGFAACRSDSLDSSGNGDDADKPSTEGITKADVTNDVSMV